MEQTTLAIFDYFKAHMDEQRKKRLSASAGAAWLFIVEYFNEARRPLMMTVDYSLAEAGAGLSRNTLLRAFDELQERGLLYYERTRQNLILIPLPNNEKVMSNFDMKKGRLVSKFDTNEDNLVSNFNMKDKNSYQILTPSDNLVSNFDMKDEGKNDPYQASYQGSYQNLIPNLIREGSENVENIEKIAPSQEQEQEQDIYNIAAAAANNNISNNKGSGGYKNGDEIFYINKSEIYNDDYSRVVTAYNQNIGIYPMGGSWPDELIRHYLDKMGVDVLEMAIKETSMNFPENPAAYFKKVLEGWDKAGVDSVEKAEAYCLERKRKRERKKSENGFRPRDAPSNPLDLVPFSD
jgi:hypothetical protein